MTVIRPYKFVYFSLINCLISSILFTSLQLPVNAQTESSQTCLISQADLEVASSIVTELHDSLISVMQEADSLGYEGRFNKLAPFITSNFNFPLISRTILGRRYWDTITEKQKIEFIEIFRQLSIANFADRFDSFNEEKFAEIERRKLPSRGKCPAPPNRRPPAKRILIKTELQRTDDDPVRLEYLQQEINDKWYIITVIANGVNDLSLKRGEYTDVIKKKGFDGLLDEIKIKIKNMENATES